MSPSQIGLWIWCERRCLVLQETMYNTNSISLILRLVSAAIFSCIMLHMGEAQSLVLVDCFCRPTDRHVRELNVGCVKSCQAIKFADTRSAAGCPRLPWPSRRRW